MHPLPPPSSLPLKPSKQPPAISPIWDYLTITEWDVKVNPLFISPHHSHGYLIRKHGNSQGHKPWSVSIKATCSQFLAPTATTKLEQKIKCGQCSTTSCTYDRAWEGSFTCCTMLIGLNQLIWSFKRHVEQVYEFFQLIRTACFMVQLSASAHENTQRQYKLTHDDDWISFVWKQHVEWNER